MAIMATMAQSNTLGTLLDLVAQLEDTAFGFYRKLRNRCRDNPEVSEILSSIMEDERAHARMVRDIADSLPEYSRQAPVSSDLVQRLERTLERLRGRDEELFASTDATCAAIEGLEALEFDVVLSFVSIPEVEYDFADGYVQDQAVDHTNKVYRLLRALG
jgi:rubrerythrin